MKDILEENQRRKALLRNGCNQLTGEGIGGRTKVSISDYRHREVWLPDELLRHELVAPVVEAGSIRAYLRHQHIDDPSAVERKEVELDNLRIAADPYYAFATVFMIKDKNNGSMHPFFLNYPQRLLLAEFEQMRLNRQPIRLILLKARQWGGSTLTQLYMAWIQLFQKDGWNSLIVAQTKDTARRIKAMYTKALNNFPEQVFGQSKLKFKPMERSASDSLIADSKGRALRDNVITISSFENYESTRGSDIAMAHFSEVAYWRTTPQKSSAGLIRAVTSGMAEGVPLTMEVMESTANGKSGYFYDEYQEAKAGHSARRALFIPFFYIENDMLPFADEAEEAAFARWLTDNKGETSSDEKTREPGVYLWSLWTKGATLEHIKWYVSRRKLFHSHGQIASEAPSDDVECFTFSGKLMIAAELIQLMEDKVKCRPRWRGDINTSTCELSSAQHEHGPLKIWEMPVDDAMADRYIVSVDVGGRTAGADWSVITVLDRCDPPLTGMPLMENAPHEQRGNEYVRVVARWRAHIGWKELAWKAVAIARFYGDALLAFESNTFEKKEGESLDFTDPADHTLSVLSEVRNNYGNLYIRNSSSPDDLREGRQTKIGFHTNRQTKQIMVDNFTHLFEGGLFLDPDEQFYKELSIYEQRTDGSYGNIPGYGNHDDIVMTDMIGVYVHMRCPLPPPLRRESAPPKRRGTINESDF